MSNDYFLGEIILEEDHRIIHIPAFNILVSISLGAFQNWFALLSVSCVLDFQSSNYIKLAEFRGFFLFFVCYGLVICAENLLFNKHGCFCPQER